MTNAPSSPAQRATFALIVAVFALLVVACYLTRGGDPSLEYNAPPPLPNTGGLVDQGPLRTARQLAAQAATPAERQYASRALRLSDNEVDEAFAAALRDAAGHPAARTPEEAELSRRIAALGQRIKQEQAEVAALAAGLPKAPDQDAAGQRLDLAKAQLSLDTDELSDLHQDLIRLGGDRRASIQQALDEHEAVQHAAGSTPSSALAEQMESPAALRTMPGKFRALAALGNRAAALRKAREDALDAARSLGAEHDKLEAAIEAQTRQQASGAPAQDVASRAAAITSLRALSSQREALAQLGRRVHDEQRLATAYQKWETLVRSQKRTVLHRVFRVFAIIFFLAGAVFLISYAIERFVARRVADRRRRHTLRVILTLLVQITGLTLILLIAFGAPRQLSTVIGLITAGLTVVLKDFIVAFFGWFVLMGRHGMRPGDWVEIDGVSGEVAEIGILRTTLLETGNWTETGHPTGRRVAFMNSFAIEGKYFNFSTTGQWLWDELRVTVPAGPDALRKVESIRQAVEDETRQDAATAEQEWTRASRSAGVESFSAAPHIGLRPAPDTIQLIVRYVTRAQERLSMRSRLYEKILGIVHTNALEAGAASAPDEAAIIAGEPRA